MTKLEKIKQLVQKPLTRVLLALILIFVVGIIFNADGAFFKWSTHRDMLRQVSVCGILACGMTLVIISGGIDLAVGSILGVIAVTFSLLSIHFGLNPIIVIPLCLLFGAACGAVSGIIIGRFRIQPFIATLGMMVFARGLAKLITGGQKISTAVQQTDGSYKYIDIPHIFEFLNSKLLGDNVAVVSIIFILCIAIAWLLLAKFRLGRYIYAIGGNEEAARLSGIPVTKIKIATYALSGFFCAVAGICQAAQEFQGDPEAGATYELAAIAMVVIGGTSLTGGRGSMPLTMLGILTIGYLEKILSINAIGESSRLMLSGAIIITAVLLQKKK
jgi:ribose transport system permease protein